MSKLGHEGADSPKMPVYIYKGHQAGNIKTRITWAKHAFPSDRSVH